MPSIRINVPPVTRAIVLLLIGLTVVHGLARFNRYEYSADQTPVAYLVMVPWKLLFNPWTMITAALVEHNLFIALITAPTFFYGGKYLERAWSSMEFAKFMLVVAVATNLSIAILYVLWSLTVKNIAGEGICSGIAIVSAFLVAFKQLVPEHTVTFLNGVVKMRVKHFPALFLAFNTIGSLLVFSTATPFNLSWLGFIVSWTYLRFFKRQPDLSGTSTSPLATVRGDASDTFAFACFFPDVMQPAVSSVSDKAYDFLVRIKAVRPFTEEAIASSNEQAIARGQAGLPSLLSSNGRSWKREEAERRRALALKALDQRLHAASAQRAAERVASRILSTSSPIEEELSKPSATAQPAVVSSGEPVLGQISYSP